jgi:menaquinone-dependent protoporphyrinogen oxidase
MFKVLVVYGSTYGQTDRVAHRIAAVLSNAGHTVDIHRADQLPDALWLAAYDGFVVAASVLMGHHQEYVRDFVRRNATLLNKAPSAFVSVCGAARDDPPQAQAYIDALLRETGWHPTVTHSFAGAVAYTRYGWWFRWYLQMISRRKGLPTDTSRDWDLTEWDAVDRFAEELAVALALAPAQQPVHAS